MNPDIRSEMVKLDHVDALTEDPDYARLNLLCDLPSQSIVLAEAVEQYGVGQMQQKLMDIHQNAPFLFQSNFFLSNIKYFLDNLDSAKQLEVKINNLSQNLISADPNDSSFQIVQAMASLARNRAAGSMQDILPSLHAFADSLNLGLRQNPKRMPVLDFEIVAKLFGQCNSTEDFEKMLAKVQEGGKTRTALGLESIMEMPKMPTIGLKILTGCTIQCSFCSEETVTNPEKWQVLTLNDIKGMLPLFRESGSISISGGEPFDHPQLLQICQFFSENHIPFTIVTTGGDIERLDELHKYLKDGSILSLTISVHDFYGTKGKKRSGQTIAFLIRNNIPFKINFSVPSIESGGMDIQPFIRDLLKLGLHFQGQEQKDGRTSNNLTSSEKIKRDPLARVYMVPIYPAGKFGHDSSAQKNLDYIREHLLRTIGDTAHFCHFGNVVIRADKTVSPCDNVMEGGDSGVPRLMDHLPKSVSEIIAAMRAYGDRCMKGVISEARRTNEIPCVVHRESKQRGLVKNEKKAKEVTPPSQKRPGLSKQERKKRRNARKRNKKRK